MRDEALRAACFSRLAVLAAQFDDDVPYRGGRVPFLDPERLAARFELFRARSEA